MRVRVLLRVVAVVTGAVMGVMGVASPARADCAAPQIAVAPYSGQTVPENPTVWVYVPTWRVPAEGLTFVARAGNHTLPVTSDQVSHNRAFVSFRLRVQTQREKKFSVHLGADRLGNYKVRTQEVPARHPAKLGASAVTYENWGWTCSHTDAFFLSPPLQAPAYRVEWAPAPGQATEQSVFPHHIDDPWDWTGPKPRPVQPARVAVGHPNCMDETLSQPVPRKGYVRITALFADGSEVVGPWQGVAKP